MAHHGSTHRRRQNLYALPSAQWRLLAAPPFSLLETLSAVDDAIDSNADLADDIVTLATTSMGLPSSPPKGHPLDWRGIAKPSDHTKAHSTLRQFYRDWSAEGYAQEVKPLLDLVLSDLSTHLPKRSSTQTPPSLLLPGAGLARLLLELTLAGYNVIGNEISYHQLLASNFILNATPAANSYTIYPFCTSFTNVTSRANQLRSYTIPDVHPGTATQQAQTDNNPAIPPVGEMGMAAGDFITSFSDAASEGAHEAVVTVYFIDTAPNLLRYIDTIRHCLTPGGLWVNIGPLLWHFDARGPKAPSDGDKDGSDQEENNNSDANKRRKGASKQTSNATDTDTGVAEPGSFELTHDEVLALLEHCGFEVLSHEILPADFVGGGGAYIQDPESMMQSRYRNAHWVARKRTAD